MRTILFSFFLCVSVSFSQYSLNVERIGGAQRAGEENTFRAALVNNGKTIHTIERTIPFDVPFPASYVDESTGLVLLTFAFDGFVEVYDNKGTRLWTHNFFKEMGPNYERTITAALGGSSIVFLTSDVTLPNAKVHKFAVNGAKEWETLLPHSNGYEIAISADVKTIIAGSYFVLEDEVRQSAAILSEKGVIVGNVNILFRKAAFSGDNKFVALTSEREIVVISNETKKEIGRAGKLTDGIITDIIWNGNTLIVQESEVKTTPEHTFYFADPTFVSYSKELKEITKKRIDTISFKTSTLVRTGNNVALKYDGTTVHIHTSK